MLVHKYTAVTVSLEVLDLSLYLNTIYSRARYDATPMAEVARNSIKQAFQHMPPH